MERGKTSIAWWLDQWLLISIDIYWYLLISIDIYWYLLISIDIYWHLLISIDIYWYLLISIDIYWHLLISIDIYWYLLICSLCQPLDVCSCVYLGICIIHLSQFERQSSEVDRNSFFEGLQHDWDPFCRNPVRSNLNLSTLWLFNIAMENAPFIDGLPMFTY